MAEPGTVIPQRGPKLCQRGEGFSGPSLPYSSLLLPLSHLLWLVSNQGHRFNGEENTARAEHGQGD